MSLSHMYANPFCGNFLQPAHTNADILQNKYLVRSSTSKQRFYCPNWDLKKNPFYSAEWSTAKLKTWERQFTNQFVVICLDADILLNKGRMDRYFFFNGGKKSVQTKSALVWTRCYTFCTL